MTFPAWPRAAALVLLFGTAAGSAQAATVTVSSNLPDAPQDNPFDFQVAAFDNRLGTLTAVSYAVDFLHVGTATYTSLTGGVETSWQAIGYADYIIVSASPGFAAVPAFGNRIYDFFFQVVGPGAPYSVTDSHGWSFSGATDAPGGSTAGSLADWTPGPVVGFNLAFFGAAGVCCNDAPTRIEASMASVFSADLSVTYTYTPASGGGGPVDPAPVPLPAAMPLLLIGLGALGVARRRRDAEGLKHGKA